MSGLLRRAITQVRTQTELERAAVPKIRAWLVKLYRFYLLPDVSAKTPIPQRLIDEGVRLLAAIYDRAAKDAEKMGRKLTFDELRGIDRIKGQLGRRVVGITETTRKHIEQAFKDAIEAGEGWQGFKKRVEQISREFPPKRARTIARTETHSVLTAAIMDSGKRGGFTHKRWVSVMDERTRPTHVAAHNAVVRADQFFTVGGARLEFPGDMRGPASEVINCRCTMVFFDKPDEPPPPTKAIEISERAVKKLRPKASDIPPPPPKSVSDYELMEYLREHIGVRVTAAAGTRTVEQLIADSPDMFRLATDKEAHEILHDAAKSFHSLVMRFPELRRVFREVGVKLNPYVATTDKALGVCMLKYSIVYMRPARLMENPVGNLVRQFSPHVKSTWIDGSIPSDEDTRMFSTASIDASRLLFHALSGADVGKAEARKFANSIEDDIKRFTFDAVLRHEVGHAIDAYIRKHTKRTERNAIRTYSIYSGKNTDETVAEFFAFVTSPFAYSGLNDKLLSARDRLRKAWGHNESTNHYVARLIKRLRDKGRKFITDLKEEKQ